MRTAKTIFWTVAAAFLLSSGYAARAQESLLYSFGAPGCASQPDSAPVFDGKGNIFGSCQDGSTDGFVFELSPNGAGGWAETAIYTFGQNNSTATGSGPNGLVFDAEKVNLFGTTSAGGAYGAGVVFELSPATGGGWTETVLYSFGTNGANDGNVPKGGLVFDAAGNLYGTTSGGGAGFDSGTVFELTPGATWTETILHSFTILDFNGTAPINGLIFDGAGNLYGTTSADGGTIFELTPGGGGTWTIQPIGGFPSLSKPVGNLVMDKSGNLYGATAGNGSIVNGTVYEFSPGAGGTWTETVLHTFAPTGSDGTNPAAGVVLGPNGTLYGTTSTGGLYSGPSTPTGYGTIFELIPGTTWTEKVLYNFDDKSDNDGYNPGTDLAVDSAGNLYGSSSGGVNSAGAIFELTSPTTVDLPRISPAAGSYIPAQSVEIVEPTTGATVYYTTTGTAPTTSSTKYTGAFTVSSTETVEAMGVLAGYTNSAVATAKYVITPPAATPVFSPAAGTFATAQKVTITDGTTGAAIFYTTNGTSPTTSSTKYSTAISVTSSETIKAIAIATGYSESNLASEAYTIETPAATPVISPGGGTYIPAQKVTITDTTTGSVIYYSTNGTAPTTASTKYSAAFTVAENETVKAIAVAPEYLDSAIAVASYVITPPAATPAFSPAAGSYATAQKVTITDASSGATIYYTTNGTPPTTSSTKYAGAIAVSASETIKAIAVATGDSASAVGAAAYVIEAPAARPVISPASGSYTGAQTITMTDTTPSAVIYYTTDGSTPTTSSTKYSAGFPASSAVETVKAIAVAPGYTPSTVATVTYSVAWLEKVLDTAWPSESYGLVMDAKGNLYSTTFHSGANNSGGVYELSPGANGTWTQKLLYSFASYTGDGSLPEAGLTIDSAGNLYGTTTWGGKYGTTYNNGGTVFELSPAAGGAWTEKVLYSFGGPGTNGTAPCAAPTLDAKGNLYGTANNSSSGSGAVYELSPAANGSWTYRVLYAFGAAANDGSSPFDSVIFDANGNLYGTTYSGGTHGNGNVFELTPTTTGPWTEKVLYNFGASATDGQDTFAGLTLDSHNNLYGTTSLGGSHGDGTVFELTPTATLPWTEKVLYNFGASTTDSSGTGAGVVFDSQGNLYGSAGGGAYGQGTVFQLAPAANGAWTETILNSFGENNKTDGTNPSSLIIDAAGNLYGTTTRPFGTGVSTVFEIETTAVASPQFSPAPGTYAPGQTVTITDGTPGATIYYTTNGTAPTTASTKYTAAIALPATATIKALAVSSGFSYSAVSSATYTIGTPTATPVISPAAGTYATAQTITISDATTGAVIYYSTNGTSPTAASTKYTAAFKLSASATVKAAAIAPLHPQSATAASSYTIETAAASPTFTPAAGTYSATQSVKIADSTTGATIYYTTNATTPTTLSTKYTGAITVSKTETVKAIAVATGYTQSAVVSAAYTIAPAITVTPKTLSFANTAVGATSAPQTVTVANTGSAVATLTSITVTGTGAAGFEQLNNCGGTLAAGVSCTVFVSFKPTAAGAAAASLSVADNATGSPQTVGLSGTGTAVDTVTLSKTGLTFAATAVGVSAEAQAVTLTNAGTAILSVTGIAISGTNASSFSELNTCGTTLAPAASCLIYVSFKPVATGALSGSLTITDSGAGSPQVVKLAGTGG